MRLSGILIFPLLLSAACKPGAPPLENGGNTPNPEMAALLRQNDSLRSAIEALKGQLNAGSTDNAAAKILLRYELPTHPVELGDYLEKQQTALMPAGGDFGSDLHIETALPLEGNHVFVTGSDGHNYRYWLLQYEAKMGKGVSWKRVWEGKAL